MTSHDRLAIRGLVADAGLDLDYPTCREMPETCQVADVGTLVRGKEGRAITFAAIVQRARVDACARWVNIASHSGGFAVSVPMEEVEHAVVIYALEDEPLPSAKGGPFRLIVPGHADECVHVKNVDSIEFAAERGRDTRPVDDAEHACFHAERARMNAERARDNTEHARDNTEHARDNTDRPCTGTEQTRSSAEQKSASAGS